MDRTKYGRIPFILLIFLIIYSGYQLPAKQKKILTFQDIMKFKQIKKPVIDDNGTWLTYASVPDRGNSQVKVVSIPAKRVHTIDRGSNPIISANGHWVAAALTRDSFAPEKEAKKKHEPDLLLLATATGKSRTFKRVKTYVFTTDAKWLIIHFYPADKNEGDKKKEKKSDKESNKKFGDILLIDLENKREISIPRVSSFAIDKASLYLAFVQEGNDKWKRALLVRKLKATEQESMVIHQQKKISYFELTWSKKSGLLAFLTQAETANNRNLPPGCRLWIWNGKKQKLIAAEVEPHILSQWVIPPQNKLRWTEDEQRLFLGLKPQAQYKLFYEKKNKAEKKEDKRNPFDIYEILDKRGVDVWHWQDPFVIPQQKKQWSRFKQQTYPAVFWLPGTRLVILSDGRISNSRQTENSRFLLAGSGHPYFRETTWDGWYQDVYLVSLKNGSRRKILTRHQHDVHLSPGGRYVVYYKDKHWYLMNTRTQATKCLTTSIPVPFYNEDHDYPSAVPSYHLASWLARDRGVLIYDKYDIWQFSTATGKGFSITKGEGRRKQLTFRICKLDPEAKFLKLDESLLLTAYSNCNKHTRFYQAKVGTTNIRQLVSGDKKYSFVQKAKNAGLLLYTRQDFREFPDIWWANPGFHNTGKLTNENPQIDHFIWGRARLIGWRSMDGIPLQGVVITPENHTPEKRYPVLVYYYRFFSQRLYEFNPMVINHRPCFPFYTSNGYVIFLPDIRFEVGQPGFAATKCLVPGVQKLIDLGIANPNAVALHGHSWSGYQTAYVITQTDLFAAAIAGAPVSNMTSAYSGIRWGSGMARQFQYEKSQSRIGGTLWDARQKYIDNSPVFFADRIKTPLLIQFGDKDDAVPWYQGIELYLALRRLNKNCIFLQYRNEPHHLKQYANKLDYSMKMKQYLDHYLKGATAAEWIKQGVPYRKN